MHNAQCTMHNLVSVVFLGVTEGAPPLRRMAQGCRPYISQADHCTELHVLLRGF